MISVGAAKVEITPAVGATIGGHLVDVPSKGVHDPLYAKALVARRGEETVALVSCDLIGLKTDVTAEVCKRIRERTGIPEDRVMIASSHTHSGPLTRNTVVLRRDERYIESLREKLATVVADAIANLQPAEIGIGVGEEKRISWNSRPMLKDGRPAWYHPSPEEILRPTGPCDQTVHVISARGADRRRIAVLYNFPCHANAGLRGYGNHLSADYPGAAGEVIERELGGMAVFTAGASGNIHPLAYSDCCGMGRMLGETVVGIAKGIRHASCERLSCVREEIALPVREHSAKEIEQIEFICDRTFRSPERSALYKDYFRKHAEWCREIRRTQGAIPAVVQVAAIGDIALVGVSGELFTELGLEIRERSPFSRTLIVTHANDTVGYIPSATGYEDGGYQPFNTTVGRGSGETVVAKALELLGRCKKVA